MSDVTLLPAVLIVLPIVAATVPILAGTLKREVGWIVATITLVVEAALAVRLGLAVFGGESRIVHRLGGYGRPGEGDFAIGIELVADAFSIVMVLLIAGVSLAVLAFARRAGPGGNPFYAGYLLLTGGLMGVALTGDLFNLFVFLEISGLATYALVASARSARSAVASLKYLIIGTTGASLYLVGVGYLFLATGTLNMVDVSRTLAGAVSLPFVDGPMYSDPLVIAGFVFIAIGLAVKAAIFPLHVWQPDAYEAAPDSVTVYISALVSTLAAYAFARVSLTVFTPAFFTVQPTLIEGILLLGGISLVAGSALAASRTGLKRMFAYSSVAQFGLIVLAIGVAVHPAADDVATRYAIIGAVVHLIGHAIIKGGLFASIGVLNARSGIERMSELGGLADRQPVIAASMAILGFALVGVPPTIGFVSKWYILLGAAASGLWLVVAVVALSTLLTLLYVARIVERSYFAPMSEPIADPAVATDGGDRVIGGASAGMVAVAVVAALLAIGLGFLGAGIAVALDPFVEAVLDGSPVVSSSG